MKLMKMSLPTRERGLKLTYGASAARDEVAPYAGAWIETYCFMPTSPITIVAPYAGAWIETKGALGNTFLPKSLPTRERGLKLRKLGDITK